MPKTRQLEILNFIRNNENCSSGDIHKEFATSISYATVKRILSQLLTGEFIISEGKGKGTRYFISPSYELLYSIDLDSYYEKEVDERQIKEEFNLEIFDLLGKIAIFSVTEPEKLSELQQKYKENILITLQTILFC